MTDLILEENRDIAIASRRIALQLAAYAEQQAFLQGVNAVPVTSVQDWIEARDAVQKLSVN